MASPFAILRDFILANDSEHGPIRAVRLEWDFWCILKAGLNDIVYELYRVAQSIPCSVLFNGPHGLLPVVNYV